MIQIDRVEAVQFNRVMTSGRTSPLLLSCERVGGDLTEVVAKFATGGECTGSSLCAELIAVQLAADLGLPVPSPLIVEWDATFAASLRDPQAQQLVNASRPPAFGSTHVTDGFAVWSAGRQLLQEARNMALAIFFFDALIGNGDRRDIKPNILVRGDDFRLIDHELAFRDYMLLAKPAGPWETGGMSAMVVPGAHIFAARLMHDRDLAFEPIRAAWSTLSDQQVDAYLAALPPQWLADRSLATFAIRRIKECRDKIDECVAECRRALHV